MPPPMFGDGFLHPFGERQPPPPTGEAVPFAGSFVMSQAHASSANFDSAAIHQGRAWMERHQEELHQRASACFSRVHFNRREEALAEAFALIYGWAVSAACRGALGNLTPFWCVTFAYRHYRSGRRFGGSHASCVMSDAAQIRGRSRRVSMDPNASSHEAGRFDRARLCEALESSDDESPFEKCRQAHDYPFILEQEQVSQKARATLVYLAETHGSGRQTELAAELKVSPARITQCKTELAKALARHDYSPLSTAK